LQPLRVILSLVDILWGQYLAEVSVKVSPAASRLLRMVRRSEVDILKPNILLQDKKHGASYGTGMTKHSSGQPVRAFKLVRP